MLGTSLRGAVDSSTCRARIRTIASVDSGIEIQAHEDLIEQRIIFTATCSFEGVKKSGVVEHIRRVEIPITIQLQPYCPDVADVDVHVPRDVSSQRQREVLNIRRREVRIESGNRLI